MTDYKDSGVNIELGDDASKILYNAARQTWINRTGKLGEVVEVFEDFAGLRAINVGGLPRGTLMNMSFDGVGTKVEIAERTGRHDTVAHDLFAMVCDDAVVRGAEPVIIGSILDVNSLGRDGKSQIELVRQLARGYISAAKEANVAVVNGEVAELGPRVQGFGEFCYNWGAGIVWFGKKERMFTGMEIKSGDYIVGLREEGFRSNGISLVRKIMRDVYGQDWHKLKDNKNQALGELVLTPSRIYSAAVVDMFGGLDNDPKAQVHGVVHVTGGGVPGKLGRVLKPSGFGAIIDDPFAPSDIVKKVQSLGEVSDREAYRTWNMGQGMLVITPDPGSVRDVASKYGIESKVIGSIIPETSGRIVINSRGVKSPSTNLYFDRE